MNFEDHLAPYAALSCNSTGRLFMEESEPTSRTQFQRDRDRIIHSAAFRRLEYKTQVFVNHEGDLFRTRLTHSIEVAQIGRSIARNLNLNEDLVEAISLAHDLGHTPFGHAGQDALNACMKDFGGFEHNLQSLRVVDKLEEHYAAFDGLNLMFETREGILKHCSLDNAKSLGNIGMRFIDKKQASLEAQLTNLADEIAYNNHDVDDGLRSGLVTIEQMSQVDLFARYHREVQQSYPDIAGRRIIHETIRRMINALVTDLITTSKERIQDANLKTIADVRNAPPLIRFSDSMRVEATLLKRFLRENLYQHYQVNRMTHKARRIVTQLFGAFMEEPGLLPPDYQVKFRLLSPEFQVKLKDASEAEIRVMQARRVADYIAGMTDRYAIGEHGRILGI